MILILQIGKLRLGEIQHIIQYLNKGVTGGARTRTKLALLLVHHTSSLALRTRAWGGGGGCGTGQGVNRRGELQFPPFC